jgi:hypothetical protein
MSDDNFFKGKLSRMDRRLFLDWDANACSEADDGVKVSTEVAKLHPSQSYHEDFGDEMVKRWNEREAMMAEIEKLRRWSANVMQDQCENAYVPVTLFDQLRQALYETNPNHPALKGEPPAFGVWEKLRKECAGLRSKLAEAKKERARWVREARVFRNLVEREGVDETETMRNMRGFVI